MKKLTYSEALVILDIDSITAGDLILSILLGRKWVM